MRQSIICVIFLLGLAVSFAFAPGCMDSLPKNQVQTDEPAIPEPETGIVAWIDAVNDRDYGTVYDLLPSSKRDGIDREQFIRFNRDNPSPFLASDPVVSDFWIMERKVDGLNATITAGLETTQYAPGRNESSASQTVFFTFDETFEENRWTVWTK
jgi:hypothetical protein